jgi:hypothetical protein
MQERSRPPRPSPRSETLRVELGQGLATRIQDLQAEVEALGNRLLTDFPAPLVPPAFVAAPWLRAHEFGIALGDRQVSAGRAWPGRVRATGPSRMLKGLVGIRDADPFFGDPCTWLSPPEAPLARAAGLDLTGPAQVIAEHLERVWRVVLQEQAALQRVEDLLGELAQSHPALVSRAGRRIGREALRQILGNLAGEGLSRSVLRGVLESLATQALGAGGVEDLTERLRVEVGDWLCRPVTRRETLPCLTLAPDLQAWLFTWVARGANPRRGEGWLSHLARRLREDLAELESGGSTPALLVLPSLRPTLARVLRPALPRLRVLKTSEVNPTLQILDLARIRIPDWRMQASRWMGSALLGGALRHRLKSELEDYDRCLQRRALSVLHRTQARSRRTARKARPSHPPELTVLTPLQKAAVLMLECPTWVLRELISKLNPSEINRLGREMIRMGPHCRVFRDQVLQELPGGARGALELGQLLSHLRGLLQEAARPETVLSEVALCLSLLPEPLRGPVAGRVLTWLREETAAALRSELDALRAEADPHRAACALRRFVEFRRGGLHAPGVCGQQQLSADLQRATRANPREMACALERLWLCPEEHLPESFVAWCEENPHRAAHWLVRWARYWQPPGPDPELQVQVVLRTLPEELAGMVREHLTADLASLVKEDPSAEIDPAEASRRCLEEFYLATRPAASVTGLNLN